MNVFNRLLIILLAIQELSAQSLAPLTIEKIMRDPKKWIGTSPTDITWSDDSKSVYFNWNPDHNPSDSLYIYSLTSKKISKVTPPDRKKLPGRNGVYNRAHSARLYEKDGDIFIISYKDFVIKQLTNT